jgi:hypothetical protein
MNRAMCFLALLGCLAGGWACQSREAILAEDWVRARTETEGDCLLLAIGNSRCVVVQTAGADVRPGSRWHRPGQKVWVRVGAPVGRSERTCGTLQDTQVRLLEIKSR